MHKKHIQVDVPSHLEAAGSLSTPPTDLSPAGICGKDYWSPQNLSWKPKKNKKTKTWLHSKADFSQERKKKYSRRNLGYESLSNQFNKGLQQLRSCGNASRLYEVRSFQTSLIHWYSEANLIHLSKALQIRFWKQQLLLLSIKAVKASRISLGYYIFPSMTGDIKRMFSCI